MLHDFLRQLSIKTNMVNLLNVRTMVKVFYASKHFSSEPLKQFVRTIFDLCPDYAKTYTKHTKDLDIIVDEIVLPKISELAHGIVFLQARVFGNASFPAFLHFALHLDYAEKLPSKEAAKYYLQCSKVLHKSQPYKRAAHELLDFSFKHAKNLISIPANLALYSALYYKAYDIFGTGFGQGLATVVSFGSSKLKHDLAKILAATKVKVFVCKDYLIASNPTAGFDVEFCKKCGKPTKTTLDFINLLKFYAL